MGVMEYFMNNPDAYLDGIDGCRREPKGEEEINLALSSGVESTAAPYNQLKGGEVVVVPEEVETTEISNN